MNHKEHCKKTLSCQHSILGSCLEPCPWCGVYGFWSPKEVENNIAYACKWCGIWQKHEGEPYRCIALACRKCGGYGNTKSNLNKPCDYCGSKTEPIKWPIDSANNPSYKIIYEIRDEVYQIHQYPFYPVKISKVLIDLMIRK